MEGLRERIEVGVEGTEDEVSEEGYWLLRPGKGSLNLAADNSGDGEPDVGVRTGGVATAPPKATWWSGEAGLLRLDKEPVLLYKDEMGEA